MIWWISHYLQVLYIPGDCLNFWTISSTSKDGEFPKFNISWVEVTSRFRKNSVHIRKANQIFHEFGGIEGGVFSWSKIKMENEHFRLRSADHLLDSQQYLNKKTGDLGTQKLNDSSSVENFRGRRISLQGSFSIFGYNVLLQNPTEFLDDDFYLWFLRKNCFIRSSGKEIPMELQVEAALRGEEMRWIISSVQWRRSLIITENDDV